MSDSISLLLLFGGCLSIGGMLGFVAKLLKGKFPKMKWVIVIFCVLLEGVITFGLGYLAGETIK